jgi:hypothetical protein
MLKFKLFSVGQLIDLNTNNINNNASERPYERIAFGSALPSSSSPAYSLLAMATSGDPKTPTLPYLEGVPKVALASSANVTPMKPVPPPRRGTFGDSSVRDSRPPPPLPPKPNNKSTPQQQQQSSRSSLSSTTVNRFYI